MSRMRRGLVALSGAVALVAAVGPPVSAHDPELEEIERRLEQRQEQLEEATEESRDVRGQLSASQQHRRGLTAEVRLLQSDLAAAQARLAEVEAALEVARDELARWTRRLERARADLLARQDLLNAKAATAYILGPAAYAEALLGANDLGSMADRTFYVERVLAVDTDLLAGVRVSRELVATRQDRMGVYEDNVAERFRTVRRHTERIAAMKARQEALLEQIDLEIEYTAGALGELNSARERYEDAVAQLEAESAQIQGLIQGSGSTGSGQYGGELFWPTNGPIVSGFGYRTHPVYGTTRFHAGVDIDGACGQPIFAAEDGTVLSAGYNGGYGNATVIDHGGGLSTLYAHQSSIGVSSGQKVGRGQQIGLVGTTGLSTGCHLHFEVRVNGEPVDPVPYLT
jgi:murein DD-endopeptidase MepM/ murein hydrolase activator NlpD